MFSDVIPCGTKLKLHIYTDLTYHMLFKLHKGLPVINNGLYVMCEGLAVMHKETVCHVP